MQDRGLPVGFVGNGKLVKVWGRADQSCTLGKKVNLCFEQVSHRGKINRGWETSWEGVRNSADNFSVSTCQTLDI